jgi:hypothetical protein
MTPLRRGWHAVVAIFDFSVQKGNRIFIAAARCLELRCLMWILFSWEFNVEATYEILTLSTMARVTIENFWARTF